MAEDSIKLASTILVLCRLQKSGHVRIPAAAAVPPQLLTDKSLKLLKRKYKLVPLTAMH